jgi:Phosphodiester glycosidase
MRIDGTPVRRRVLRLLAGFAVVAAATSGLSPGLTGPVHAATGPVVHRYHLAPGIVLTRIRYPGPPYEVRILKVTPSRGPRLDLAAGQSEFPLWKRTSDIAASHNGAIAAVNSDFTTAGGEPTHVTMMDGELWSSGESGGTAFATSENGQAAFAGHPKLRMKLTTVDGQSLASVAKWNVGEPKLARVAGYTHRGGTQDPPPGKWSPAASDPKFCAVRLVPIHGYPLDWSGKEKTWITRRYKVSRQPEPCRRKPLPLGKNPANIVLAAHSATTGGRHILRLSRGERVKMWWSFDGWPGVTDVTGAGQQLVDNGKNVGPAWHQGDPNIFWFNPRTTVGVTKNCVDNDPTNKCTYYLVTVDGRQPNWSKGMKYPGLADELLKRPIWDAVNFDGGGSTTMWVKRKRPSYCERSTRPSGCLVNRPSMSSGERIVIEALTVLSGADSGTPRSLR